MLLVDVQEAAFSWSGDQEDCQLLNVDLQVARGQLIGVFGNVGSGKTSLLVALAGELSPCRGSIRVRSDKMAIAPQQPFIQNATLLDNVLFGNDLDAERYKMVIDACALQEDLRLLPAGDATEIGEKVSCLLVAQS